MIANRQAQKKFRTHEHQMKRAFLADDESEDFHDVEEDVKQSKKWRDLPSGAETSEKFVPKGSSGLRKRPKP